MTAAGEGQGGGEGAVEEGWGNRAGPWGVGLARGVLFVFVPTSLVAWAHVRVWAATTTPTTTCCPIPEMA